MRLSTDVRHLPGFHGGGRRRDCKVCKERVRRRGEMLDVNGVLLGFVALPVMSLCVYSLIEIVLRFIIRKRGIGCNYN